MPTYQYACTACGYAFERVQSLTDPAITSCPECEGKVRKLYNSVGVVFKGSGFYRTDSRTSSDSSKPAESKPAESTPAESTPSAPKTSSE